MKIDKKPYIFSILNPTVVFIIWNTKTSSLSRTNSMVPTGFLTKDPLLCSFLNYIICNYRTVTLPIFPSS